MWQKTKKKQKQTNKNKKQIIVSIEKSSLNPSKKCDSKNLKRF